MPCSLGPKAGMWPARLGCVSIQPSAPRKMHVESKISHAERRDCSTPAQAGVQTPTCGPGTGMLFLPVFSHFRAGETSRWLIPSSSALNPQAAPPLRKYSSGVPRATQEMLLYALCQPGYFLSWDWREAGPGAARTDILSCSVSSHGHLYSWQWVSLGLSVSLPSL